MALPPLASVEELETRSAESYTGAELSRAGAVLVDASNLVRDEAGKTWVDINNVVVAPDIVVTIVLKVAKRAMDNPEGHSSETMPEYAWRKDGVEDGVYLTDKECRIIRRLAGKTGLWTQATTRVSRDDGTIWVDDQFGLEPFPMYAADDLVY